MRRKVIVSVDLMKRNLKGKRMKIVTRQMQSKYGQKYKNRQGP